MLSTVDSVQTKTMPRVLKSLVFVCLVSIFVLTTTLSAKAEIFQFSKSDAKYLAALALALAAEGEEAANIEEKINLDEDLNPADFGLDSVGLLPGSPFYFAKSIRRGVTSLFTFNSVSKAKLRLRFASEKLLEANELANRENVDEKDVTGALNSFRRELDNVKAASAKAVRSTDDQKKSELSEEVMDSVVKFGKNLGKFEKTLSSEGFDDVKEARAKTAETFGAVFDLSAPDEVSAKLTEILDEQKGSEFKQFKNLEILEEIEEKVPDRAKGAIRLAQDNALNRLQAELEKFEAAKRAIFSDFVREAGGDETRHLAILNELEVRPLSQDLRNVLTGAKEETFIKTEEKLKKLADQDKKERFLAHLTNGEFEDFRLMKELEENVGEDTLRGISEIKIKVEDGLKNRVAGIKTNADRRKEFEGSVEKFHDVKSLSLIEKMEELVPEDQRAFFVELKQKAVARMQDEIASAGSRRAEDKAKIYQALAGDRPEYFGVAEGLGEISSGIKNAMYDKIGEKAKNIRNKEKLLRYEEEFKDQQRYFTATSGLEEIFSGRKSAFDSPETIRTRMTEVKKQIAELEALVNSLPIDQTYSQERGFDPVVQEINNLLAIAKRKLDRGRNYFDQGEIEKAFFVVDEAEFLAGDGIDLVEGYRAGQKRYAGPKETMEIRDGLVYVYSKYDFGSFCSGMKGFLRSSSECVAPDGDVFAADSYPISFPLTSATCSQETGCPGGYLCDIAAGSRYGKCVLEDEKISTCNAFFTGYIYDQKSASCYQKSTSGCFDPYVYHSREECEKANKTSLSCPAPYAWDSAGQRCVISLNYPFTFPASNFTCNDYQSCYDYCRTVPSHDFTEKEAVTNDACWEHWPPKCGNNVCESGESISTCKIDCAPATGYCGDGKCSEYENRESCPSDCKTQTTTSTWPGDNYSCPGFAYSRYDAQGKRYCELNERGKCAYGYPAYLDRINYTPEKCQTSLCGDNVCSYPEENETSCSADCKGATKCPLLPTVESCPAGQQKIIKFSSPECGNYYTCVILEDFYCGDGTCQSQETSASCPLDCGYEQSKWVSHIWAFKDGKKSSQILNRTDKEYLDYINSIEKQCLQISVNSFVWKPGAGDDSASNWQSFGIPDCSGTAVKDVCGDNVCQSTETQANCPSDCGSSPGKCQYFTRTSCVADSACTWTDGSGCGSGGTATTTSTSYCGNNICDSNETAASCSTDCASTVSNCPSGFHYHSDSGGYCINDQENVSGTCYNSSGTTVITCPITGYCGDRVCNSNETAASCSTDCGGTSTTTTGTAGCSDSLIALLGSDCHFMYDDSSGSRIYCDGPMTKSAKYGDTAAQSGCSSSGTSNYCGNNVCDSGETTASCPGDCGSAPTGYCGDRVCGSGETATSCYVDCGGSSTACNYNNVCEAGESSGSCPNDCSATGGGCGSVTASTDCEAKTDCKWNVSADSCQAVFACTSAGSCGNQKDCQYSGFYWCSGANQCATSSAGCNISTAYCGNNICDSGETSSSCSSDCGGGSTSNCSTPSNCFDSSICTSSGWYWYSSGCWNSPQGGTTGYCGDNACGSSETAASCPVDCGGTSTGYCGDNVCQSTETQASCSSDCGGGGGGGGCGAWMSESGCLSQTSCAWDGTACSTQ